MDKTSSNASYKKIKQNRCDKNERKNANFIKKCKKTALKLENNEKFCKNDKNAYLSIFEKFKANLKECDKVKFWIKTLISSYKVIPQIIAAVDKIIETQASTISFGYDVYNCGSNTLSQVESVIDLTDRKQSLINLYQMIKSIIKELDDEEYFIVEKKFIYNMSCREISFETNYSTRTIYRNIEKSINRFYHICVKKNWSLKFIESQVEREEWLKRRYEKTLFCYFNNLHKLDKLKIQNM